jgi:alkylation response protein AidB-like acyl-CoA dehydrogenase
MAQIRPRDLLSDSLLARLGGTSPGASAFAGRVLSGTGPGTTSASTVPGLDVAAVMRRDLARLAEVGYLNVALPTEFGGLGCTLRQAACGQRRLARHAPLTALAVSAHLYWTGAAADAYRAGDHSVRWILLEAARGALFAAGHGAAAAGGDLRFADARSRCEPAGESGYRFRNPAVLSSLTPTWDWVAVHAVHAVHPATGAGTPGQGAPGHGAPGQGRAGRPDVVLAFAGRGSRCTPTFRVARVTQAGTPGDVFATSAIGWGHSILASVQYSDARRAFNAAVAAATPTDSSADGHRDGGHPLDQWPVAEAGLRLDAMKARIADITHPWQLTPDETPDLGGQHFINIYAMRHEVAEGAGRVHDLVSQLAAAPAVAAL